MENGQRFKLTFPENHPAANSLLGSKTTPNSTKRKIFYLIEGVENIPLEKRLNAVYSSKQLKLTSQITIKPVDNSVYVEELQAGKACSEKYLAGLQAEQAPEEEMTYSKRKIKELEEEIQEEKD